MLVAKLKDVKHTPGSAGWPYCGNLIPYVHNATTYFKKRQAQYGNVFKARTPFRYFGNTHRSHRQ